MMEYTKFDVDLAKAADIKLYFVPVFTVNPTSPTIPLSSPLAVIDTWSRIPLQFPPKVTSDSRSGQWDEPQVPGADPPASVFKTSAREITLNLTYIVDGREWTTDRISGIAKRLRGYFIFSERHFWSQLVVKFKMWKFGGEQEISARLGSVSVKHGDTIVADCANNEGSNASTAFPLRTDITLDLKLWTTSQQNDKSYQAVRGMVPLTPDWY